jgi:hypothetical protein
MSVLEATIVEFKTVWDALGTKKKDNPFVTMKTTTAVRKINVNLFIANDPS